MIKCAVHVINNPTLRLATRTDIHSYIVKCHACVHRDNEGNCHSCPIGFRCKLIFIYVQPLPSWHAAEEISG